MHICVIWAQCVDTLHGNVVNTKLGSVFCVSGGAVDNFLAFDNTARVKVDFILADAVIEVIRQYDSCNTGELDRHAQHQQPCLASRTLRVVVRQEHRPHSRQVSVPDLTVL